MLDRSTIKQLAIVVMLGTLAGGLISCGADSASGNAEPVTPVEPEPQIVEPQIPTNIGFGDAPDELPEGHVRVTGVVFNRHDSPFRQEPFARGTLVAVPQDRFDDFRTSARGPLSVKVTEGKNFPVPRDLLTEPGVSRIELRTDGTFALTMTPGEYVFCLGNLSVVDDPEAAAAEVWVEATFTRTITEEDVQAVVPVYNRTTGEFFLY